MGRPRQYRRDHPEAFHFRKRNRKARKVNNKLTRHHDKARSLGGTYAPENIFMLSVEHHRYYHGLFGLRTFAESARVLMRMEELHRDIVNSERSPDLPGEHRVA